MKIRYFPSCSEENFINQLLNYIIFSVSFNLGESILWLNVLHYLAIVRLLILPHTANSLSVSLCILVLVFFCINIHESPLYLEMHLFSLNYLACMKFPHMLTSPLIAVNSLNSAFCLWFGGHVKISHQHWLILGPFPFLSMQVTDQGASISKRESHCWQSCTLTVCFFSDNTFSEHICGRHTLAASRGFQVVGLGVLGAVWESWASSFLSHPSDCAFIILSCTHRQPSNVEVAPSSQQ